MTDYIYIDSIDSLEAIGDFSKEKIIFSTEFNFPIDSLPNSIKKIHIKNHYYSHPLNNLPSGLIFLKIYAKKYPHPLNDLPETLEYLAVGSNIVNPLDNLPNSLKILHINGIYSHQLNNLPNGLEELQVLNLDPNCGMNNLPNSIKILYVDHISEFKIEKWPDSLKNLHIINYSHPLDNLPEILELFVGYKYPHQINCIPDSVEILRFNYDHNTPIYKLPKNIKKICFPNPNRKFVFKCDIDTNILITQNINDVKDEMDFFH